MKKLLTIIACILLLKTNAQDTDQKFIIITSDGLRWQESF